MVEWLVRTARVASFIRNDSQEATHEPAVRTEAPADEEPPSPRKPDPGGGLEDPRFIHPSPEGVFPDPGATGAESHARRLSPTSRREAMM